MGDNNILKRLNSLFRRRKVSDSSIDRKEDKLISQASFKMQKSMAITFDQDNYGCTLKRCDTEYTRKNGKTNTLKRSVSNLFASAGRATDVVFDGYSPRALGLVEVEAVMY
ncbi:hypothetical protein AKO1_005052 [Acrasis kona]|uniref:Uncharacterized protein n=1 Tax=Acrasis kona TaxID=1008807 RepID=A0AAW2Z662_9EUKA